MDTQNHYYGHSAILSLACGSDRVRHIKGLVQHGWSFNNPVQSMFHDFNVDTTSLFTWTRTARNWQIDAPNVHAIGAPWLYLTKGDRLEGVDTENVPLFMPRHGTRITGAGVDHQALALAYAKRYGEGRVLLHADDAKNSEAIDAWSQVGHAVTFSKSRFDPNFLMSTWEEISRARVVISDGISTSLLYAASLGVGIDIADQEAAKPWLAKYDAQLQEVFPEFYQKHSKDSRREIAMSELGQNCLKSPDELANLLSLDGRFSLSASTSYWCYSPIRKVIQVIGSETSAESALADNHWTDWLRRPLENVPRRMPSLQESWISNSMNRVRPLNSI